ncbi:MAG: protein phosphatase 2C domain-containing protein [Synergistaceae bacterium]|nr:protein phosphatase 2C domain-containing protein [Synergistaceae bacterium]MBR0168608.1 protein phosphatase 2C domain-containing protein [Synergistaceae bacterium]
MKLKVGGISVQGSYHTVNQDYFCAVNSPAGLVIVLSDGVGSCKLSHFGSRALCESVVELTFESLCEIDDAKDFLEKLNIRWLKKLRGLDVNECACTALFVIAKNDRFTIFHLGDGVAVVLADDVYAVTLDEKEEGFSNYTYAMDKELCLENWKVLSRNFKRFRGIYLSSDGVGLDQDTVFRYADFACGFFREYAKLSSDEIEEIIASWLKDWDGSDDKTIAFALGEEEEEE